MSFRLVLSNKRVWMACLLLALSVGSLVACGPNKTTETTPETVKPDSGEPDVTEPADTNRCVANNDGVIERSEVTFAVGVSVAVRRNKPGTVVKVDQKGRENDKGVLVWDFTNLDTPERANITTVDPTGRWFLSEFPQATLLTPIGFQSLTGTFYQVYRLADNTLYLEGVASEKETPEKEKVLLTYETPIPLLRFPLRLGKEWVVTSKSKGSVQGLPVTSSDQYQVRISHRGSIILPDIQFDNTLRIEVTVRQTLLGGSKRTLVQALYFHECFGEVARVESKENETNPLFTDATLVRYISF